jgi:hypothetical protein
MECFLEPTSGSLTPNKQVENINHESGFKKMVVDLNNF